AATSCADGPFPWTPETPIPQRPTLFAEAVTALSPGTTGPFGSWSANYSVAHLCLDWPAGPAGSALPAKAFPDVPVLILSGARDVRTPTSIARRVAAAFPHSRVLVVGNTGHGVATSSDCSD